MAQTQKGAIKIAAKKLGISVEQYLLNLSVGLKHCYVCRTWKQRRDFVTDRSRWDGLSAKCIDCSLSRKRPGPSLPLRKAMRIFGLNWCRDCQDWKTDVKQGRCKEHIRAYIRNKYATDQKFRARIRQFVHARKRRVAPIPPEAQEDILADFKGLCAYCDRPATTWDHIFPISKGGRTTPGNIAPACFSCNSSKNNKDVEEWLDVAGREAKEELIYRIALSYSGLYG